jgi:hypothetical protein
VSLLCVSKNVGYCCYVYALLLLWRQCKTLTRNWFESVSALAVATVSIRAYLSMSLAATAPILPRILFHLCNVLHCLCTQKIPMVQLCNGDIARPLKIVVFDHEKSGKHVPMGQVPAAAVLWRWGWLWCGCSCCWLLLCGYSVASLMKMVYIRGFLYTVAPRQINCHCSIMIEFDTVHTT